MKKKTNSIKEYLFLHIILFFFSFCGVFSKIASNYQIFSLKFIFFYGISITILFIYTLAWQQILKKIPLITAFLNKSVTIIWSMIWGIIFFKEILSIKMILGCIIVLIGVSLVVSSNE